ncbi:hypothetical protein GCM10020255_063020 [Rhodococcus baikonurensis]
MIAVVRREGVEDFLRELGADEVVPLAPGWGERIRELTDGVGAQIVVDPVGGDAFDDAVRVLAPEGRLVVIGFAGGGIPEVKVNRVLFRNISIVGAAWGEFTRTNPEAVAKVHASLVEHVRNGLRPWSRHGIPLLMQPLPWLISKAAKFSERPSCCRNDSSQRDGGHQIISCNMFSFGQ